MTVQHYTVDIPENLRDQLLEFRRANPEIRGGGAWQNPPDKTVPVWLEPLAKQVFERVGDYEFADWWANIADRNRITRWHDHPRYDLVAVAYVSVPGGSIEFQELGGFFRLEPRAGDLLVFPGTKVHQVYANPSAEPRISVAFNFIKY